MTAPPAPTNFESTTTDNGVNLSWTYDGVWFGFDGDNGRFAGFDDGLWLHPDNGIRVYYREKGATTFSEFSDISVDDTSELVNSLNQDTTYEFKVRVYTSNEYTETGIVEATTYLNESRSVSSYASPITSSVISVIDLSFGVSSHATSMSSSSERIVALKAAPLSVSNPITSSSSRGSLALEGRKTTSHSDKVTSFTYNERTSLELIDHTIDWDNGNAVWYTDWFSETRILGNEDTLAIRSLVVDDAKDPAAKVILQYDSDGDGVVDEESETIHLGRDQSVEEISGVPIDEDGFYRIKITEYSGYNSLYALDTAIVH